MNITIETAAPGSDRYRAHRTADSLPVALDAADEASADGTLVRLVVDRATAEALAASGEAYESDGAGLVDGARRWSLTVA